MRALVTEATRKASNGIVRALHQANFEVIGSDYRRLPCDIRSRYATAYYPSVRLSDSGYSDSILQLVERTKPDVLVPGNQLEPFVRDKARFAGVTRLLVPDYAAWEAAYFNDRTLASCRELGIDCPMLFSAEQAIQYLRRDDSNKVMIKPRADLGGGQGLCLVHTEADLMRVLSSLDMEEYFLQEYIPGPVENMRSVALLFDSRSELKLFFTSHKLRQWPRDGGICALGRSSWEPELVELLQPFFQHWQWQGTAEAELKVDARDGRPKLIEINPRFWGHTHFAVQAGVNFPVALCRLATGGEVSQPPYRVGFNYINWSTYLRCIGSQCLRGPARAAAAGELLANLARPRVRNNDWRDWRFTLAKTALELRDAVCR